jgi:DNA anti-recombination protein RmuC
MDAILLKIAAGAFAVASLACTVLAVLWRNATAAAGEARVAASYATQQASNKQRELEQANEQLTRMSALFTADRQAYERQIDALQRQREELRSELEKAAVPGQVRDRLKGMLG